MHPLNYVMPLAALVVFGLIFVVANPDLQSQLSLILNGWSNLFSQWLNGLDLAEFFFCLVIASFGLATMRPRFENVFFACDETQPETEQGAPSKYYLPCRNTLLAVVSLFVVYLIFEFSTLWFREFPEGFYYAGYAHQGAAWLTVALALATLLLSIIFQAGILTDPRLAKLKQLAWIWSGLNFVLAVAVYNRMYIYIQFNGMTWMRTIGLFGISTVVAGFALVVYKIARTKSFVWLVRRQMSALAIAIALYSLTPVDYLVHRYNVNQVLRGNLAPSVQICAHQITTEGFLMLTPLLDCDDAKIRDGIHALLAEKWAAETGQTRERDLGYFSSNGMSYDVRSMAVDLYELDPVHEGELAHWSHRQWSRQRFLRWADDHQAELQPWLTDLAKRDAAWGAFATYAYQWY